MIEKFLFQPVKPWVVTQGFGENKACIHNTTGKVIGKNPYLDSTPCPEGYRSVYSNMKGHNGLDTRAKRWQPVYAAHSGKVVEVETEVARGLGVGILTNKKYYCIESGKKEYFKTRYWHFIASDVHLGEEVKVGDFIGYADSTGFSSGDHLHFEMKPVELIDEGPGNLPSLKNVLQQNGYFGAVDPTPYMEDIFAVDFAGLWRKVQEAVARLNDLIADWMRR